MDVGRRPRWRSAWPYSSHLGNNAKSRCVTRSCVWRIEPMLRATDNEILTRVGLGTPMGDLLRLYWIPCLLSWEVEADGSPERIRLLGEDLVAFRDTNGEIGLIQSNCPHRGASLFFGRNEEAGIRCVYHGW